VAFFTDADGYNLVLAFVDGVEYGSRGKQGNFVLSTASAKQNSYAKFFHFGWL
jgi:hypothetical protein